MNTLPVLSVALASVALASVAFAIFALYTFASFAVASLLEAAGVEEGVEADFVDLLGALPSSDFFVIAISLSSKLNFDLNYRRQYLLHAPCQTQAAS